LQVLKENDVRKEELRARALALKILGKIFQVLNLVFVISMKILERYFQLLQQNIFL
jgi:hypothetical protein